MEINKTHKQSSHHVASISKMCTHRGSSENECNMLTAIIILELHCNWEIVGN